MLLNKQSQIFRKRNFLAILNVLQQNNRISRVEIAKITGLTPATVSNITNKLLELKLIHVIGTGSSKGGRRPLILEFHPEAFYLAGLKIGISKTIAIIMDLHGKILLKKRLPSFEERAGSSVFKDILDLVHQVIAGSGVPLEKIMGIGVSFPGLVDVEKGVGVYAPRIPEWRDVPLVELIRKEFSMFCTLENDSRASALGEARFGAGRGYRNSFFINMGPGIGSGIIVNGDLYRGSNTTAGEFGHITVNPTGPECVCGNRGCLEVMASGLSIVYSAMRAVDSGRRTVIRDMVCKGGERITADMVVRAAREGDGVARSLIREAANYVGMALADVINLLNPDAVIIGGDLSFDETFLEAVKTTVRERSFTFGLAETKICFSSLGEDASCIGAAALVLDNIFDLDSAIEQE